MSIRNDSFANHMGFDCRFWKTDNFYILQTDYQEELLSVGFKKYNNADLNHKIYKNVTFDAIESAADVSTFCTYKGFKFFVENVFNGEYILRPLDEAMEHFKDFPKHGYDPVYKAEENDIEEIWEERQPIDGFVFDIEPMVYIKKK